MASSAFMAVLAHLARVVLVVDLEALRLSVHLHDAERRFADHDIDLAARPPTRSASLVVPLTSGMVARRFAARSSR